MGRVNVVFSMKIIIKQILDLNYFSVEYNNEINGHRENNMEII